MAIKYELLGRKIEDMPTTLNYEVESVKDVRGLTDTAATIGSATTEISPVVFNKDSAFAKFMDMAVERNYELSRLEREFIVVRLFKRVGASYAAGKPAAYKQKAIVVPGDYATENQGLQMTATLHWVGQKVHGTVGLNANGEGFAAETKEPLPSEVKYKDGDAARQEYQIFFAYEENEF